MLSAQREHDGVVGRCSLQFEIKGAAEPFAQCQSPRTVHPNAERRMQHQLHASGLIKKALEHELLLGGDDAEGAVNRGEVVRKLSGPGVGQAGFYTKPVDKGFRAFVSFRPSASSSLFSTSDAQARDGLRQLIRTSRRFA